MNAAELRAQALQAQDLDSDTVEVPEWGCSFLVRQMPEEIRVSFDLWHNEQIEAKCFRLSDFCCRLISECTFDEAGERVFSEEDIGALKQKSRFAIRRLTNAALRINRMRNEDRDGAEKNSEVHESGSSTA